MNIIKQLLQESEGYITDEKEALEYLKKVSSANGHVVSKEMLAGIKMENGRVSIQGGVSIEICSQFAPNHGPNPCRVRFDDISDCDLIVSYTKFTDLSWVPKRVNELELAESTGVKLDQLDIDQCYNLNVRDCGITSLRGIHKHVRRCSHINLKGNPIENGMLDLLKIPGLMNVVQYLGNVTNEKGTYKVAGSTTVTPCEAALTLINRRLKLANVNKKTFTNVDIMKIQEELLDLDLEDYA